MGLGRGMVVVDMDMETASIMQCQRFRVSELQSVVHADDDKKDCVGGCDESPEWKMDYGVAAEAQQLTNILAS